MRIPYAVAAIGIFFVAAATTPSAFAQEGSLAGLADKTKKEREENEKGGTKVIGADDLRHTKSHVYVPPGGSTAPAKAAEGDEASKGEGDAEAEGSEEKTPAQQRADQAAELQKQMSQQQDRLSKLQQQAADTQAQLSDQSTYYPGNPRRAALEDLLNKVNAEIADAQKQIADIQRRARSQGVSLR